MRLGANGMPMPENKKEEKTETLQEILEVNPNTVKQVEEDLSSEWVTEEEEEEDDEDLQ
jgi:hypothetical protein